MRVSELEGAQLDAWVARAQGRTLGPQHKLLECDVWRDSKGEIAGTVPAQAYQPSTDWAQGGPIIEREGISLLQIGIGESGSKWSANFETWYEDREDLWVGATPLIAAMRAVVASEYGENVPDE